MTVVTLRPNSTTGTVGSPSLTGGATAHGVLSDDSDSSYAAFIPSDGYQGGLGDLSLPAGAMLKTIAVRARLSPAGPPGAPVIAGIYINESINPGARVNLSGGLVPTTITIVSASLAGATDGEIDAALWDISRPSGFGSTLRVYEYYADVTYVEQPTVTADTPTGTVTDTNLPTVTWTATLDSDGGAQAGWAVYVYTDAQYTDPDFDPDDPAATGYAATSGNQAGTASSWQVNTPLADDTYRAYVLSYQVVNGVGHPSDWEYTQFTVDVDLPAVPTLTLTADNTNGRVQIDVADNAGAATTDVLEIQRSLDSGTTWETVRQLAAGYLTPDATVYDYEAPNGTATYYRARALHSYTGLYAASAWDTDTVTWSSTSWWLKHPNRPDLNVAVAVRSLPTIARAGRQAIFQPLGATSAVVVSDTRGPKTGTVVLRSLTLAAQEDLDAILDEHATLMLQSPAGHGGPDYIRVGTHERTRIVERGDASMVWESLEFVAVPSPPGDVVAWP